MYQYRCHSSRPRTAPDLASIPPNPATVQFFLMLDINHVNRIRRAENCRQQLQTLGTGVTCLAPLSLSLSCWTFTAI
jgi:hypothetical protein